MPRVASADTLEEAGVVSSETTALLRKPSVDPPPLDAAAAESVETQTPDYRRWLAEIWLLTKASVPVILAYTLQNSLQTASVLIAGRLSPEALATAAFSYMFAMSTAWLIALGGTTALDTLASSSFTGSADKHDLGILLQRGLFVLTAGYAAVALLWWFSEPLFRALGQEEFICVQSAAFLRYLIPGGLGYIWFESMKKYLQAQGRFFFSLPRPWAPPAPRPPLFLTRNLLPPPRLRDLPTGNLRPPPHLPPQRRPQLPLHPHAGPGPLRRPARHGHRLLGLVPPPGRLRRAGAGRRVLGRPFAARAAPGAPGALCAPRRPGRRARRHRVVGL